MSRVFLNYVLPLLAPALLYVGWVALVRARGKDPAEVLAHLRQGPWFWLALSGFVLMAAGLVWFGIATGSSPDTTYQPPRYEDGRIAPSEFQGRKD